jgi:hypothetical protein
MLEKLKKHLTVFAMAVVFGLGAYAVIQLMMSISRWLGYDF